MISFKAFLLERAKPDNFLIVKKVVHRWATNKIKKMLPTNSSDLQKIMVYSDIEMMGQSDHVIDWTPSEFKSYLKNYQKGIYDNDDFVNWFAKVKKETDEYTDLPIYFKSSSDAKAYDNYVEDYERVAKRFDTHGSRWDVDRDEYANRSKEKGTGVFSISWRTTNIGTSLPPDDPDQIKNEINAVLKDRGYEVGSYNANYGNIYDYHILPVTSWQRTPKQFLYHVTLTSNVPSILKRGIIPKKSDTPMFLYDNKVHVLSPKIPNPNLTELLADISSTFKSHDSGAHSFSKAQEGSASLIEIDTSKLRKGTKWYVDQAWTSTEFDMVWVENNFTGLWTFTHIPPEACKEVKRMDLKDVSSDDKVPLN